MIGRMLYPAGRFQLWVQVPVPFLAFNKAFFISLRELPLGNWGIVGRWKHELMTGGHLILCGIEG